MMRVTLGLVTRTAVLAVVAFIAMSHRAEATPCVTTTLSNYISLGSTGCSVGSAVVSDFGLFSPLPRVATPIPASQVQVTPTSGPTSVSLLFSFSPAVSAGIDQTFETLFGY